MTRSLYRNTAVGTNVLGQEVVLAGATINVYEEGTSTPLAQSLWSAKSGGVAQSNPLTTPANGTYAFWLDTPQYLDVVTSQVGFATLRETVAVGDPVGGLTGVPGLANLTDVTITSVAKGQELIHNGTLWVNILHRYRPQGYVGYAGDGVTDGTGTDNSTVLNQMFSEAHASPRGYVEFPNHVIGCKNLVAAYPNLHVDFNGATLVQHTSSTTADDLIRGWNFASLTGTSTLVSAGTVPYKFKLQNGTLYQPTGKGRHVLALYAMGFWLENMAMFSQSVGSGLWTEYGTTTEVFQSGSPPALYGDAGFHADTLRIYDAPSGTILNLPSANDMTLVVSGVSNATNPTITVTRPHYLSAGMTVVIASVGGATGANGTWTVLAVPTATTFTITTSAPGVYTSGGTVTYSVSAAWANLGPHDSHATSVIVMATTHINGRRGIMNGLSAGASNTGMGYEHLHVYDNWDVGMDSRSSNILLSGDTQMEGSTKCCCLVRTNGRFELAGGSIYGGAGGVTLLDVRQANQNKIACKMMLAGSGNVPPSGFNNTYLYTSSVSDSIFDLIMQHDYNTNAAASAGSSPSLSFLRIIMDAYGISSATLTAGWLTSIDSTHAGIFSVPTGLTPVGTN